MSDYKLELGDALKVLQTMQSESVNTVVTSPPYYGLRDYGVDGQIGQEKTPEAYISALVDTFREAKRVLRNDGTLWVNVGDSYCGYHGNKKHEIPTSSTNGWNNGYNENQRSRTVGVGGLKSKDLIGIPWMLAFALRADGWYLRSDIIWNKPNVMPSSVKDRVTTAHEYVFMLSKSAKYYYDNEAIQEDSTCAGQVVQLGSKSFSKGQAKGAGVAPSGNGLKDTYLVKPKRNKRSVWTINTKGFKEAHFAVFPEALVEPCILAGCPEGGTVLDPFSGASTTGVVCLKNNRNYVGIELNAEYIQIATKRLDALNLSTIKDAA